MGHKRTELLILADLVKMQQLNLEDSRAECRNLQVELTELKGLISTLREAVNSSADLPGQVVVFGDREA